MERQAITNSGYSEHGASRTRTSFLKWFVSSKSAHEDISENVELLRERSRDLYAGGAPLGKGAIDRIVLNALGSGLRLNVRIDPRLLNMSEQQAIDWAAKTEAEFDYWASSRLADAGGEMTFYELQQLALKSILIDGECFAIMKHSALQHKNAPYTLRIQLIESERIQTPSTRQSYIWDEGVALNQVGNVVGYNIKNRNPNSELTGQPRLEDMYILAGRNILHIFQRERIGQHRGVPFLSPVIEQLKQLSRYTDAELMAAVVSGMYSVFFEHAPREDGAYGEDEYAVDANFGETIEGITADMMMGSVMDLPEGVKATSLSPGRPNQNFGQFIESLAHQIGGALGIPQELLYLHFTASYSASRGALLEAWKLFKYWRSWFAESFCKPVYEAFLDEAVNLGRIEAPMYLKDDFHAKLYAWSEWVGPSQGQLDPTKEVQAAVMKIANNLSTYQRETGELTGEDWDLVMSALTRERMKIPVAE